MAEEEATSLASRSRLKRLDQVRQLSWQDVQMVAPIGYGGYSQVFQVKLRPPTTEEEEDQDGAGSDPLGGFSTHSSSDLFNLNASNHGKPSYALKCLNPSTMVKVKNFRTGAVDLAIEGEILARLSHENVIALHGICSGGPLKAYMESEKGYFLILDLLQDTLQDRLDKYRSQHNTTAHNPKIKGAPSSSSSSGQGAPSPSGSGGLRRSSNSTKSSSSSRTMHRSMSTTHANAMSSGSSSRRSSEKGSSHASTTVILERIQNIAMGVAKGMEYLHSKGVALRDLKPDNVGFAHDGTPKLFDFGFAREAHTIKQTEVAGSLRYMAPEVALGRGSVLASDVYSFGVLLWELCTLEKPYKQISSRDEFMDIVILGGWRHSTSGIPSTSIRKLIKECWTDHPKDRPTFSKIVKVLRVECATLVRASKKAASSADNGSSEFAPDGKVKDAILMPRNSSLRRINTWTAKKLSGKKSSGSFSLLGAISWSKKESNSDLVAHANAVQQQQQHRQPSSSRALGRGSGSRNHLPLPGSIVGSSSGKGRQNATFDKSSSKGPRRNIFMKTVDSIPDLTEEKNL